MAPLALLLHGISGEGAVFLPLTAQLQAAGYQVLLPDFYGRGYSDAAAGGAANNVSLFTTMLAEVLLKLAPATGGATTHDIVLLGTSMGGAIAARFAELHPQLVKRLILCCPAGLVKMPMVAKLVKLPGLGEMALSMLSKKNVEKSSAKAYADITVPGADKHWAAQVERSMEMGTLHPGETGWGGG